MGAASAEARECGHCEDAERVMAMEWSGHAGPSGHGTVGVESVAM